jgi:hypothetical protein
MIRRVNRKFSNIAVPAVFDRLCFYEEVNLGRDLDTWIEDESCHDLAQHVKQVSWVWPKALTRVGQGFLARATAARALFPKLNTMRVRLQDQPKISDDRWYNDEDDEEEDDEEDDKDNKGRFCSFLLCKPAVAHIDAIEADYLVLDDFYISESKRRQLEISNAANRYVKKLRLSFSDDIEDEYDCEYIDHIAWCLQRLHALQQLELDFGHPRGNMSALSIATCVLIPYGT